MLNRKLLYKALFGTVMAMAVLLPVICSSEVLATVKRISSAAFGDVQISLDRSDLKYLDGEDVVARVKIKKHPADSNYQYDVEAMLVSNSKSTVLKSVQSDNGYFAQFSFKMRNNSEIRLSTYEVNFGKIKQLKGELVVLEKQLSDVNRLIANSPTSELLATKEKLEHAIQRNSAETATFRKLVNSQTLVPELVENDVSLVITGPSSEVLRSKPIALTGVYHGTLADVKVFVDGEEVKTPSDGEAFSYEVTELFEGPQNIILEVKRGSKQLIRKLVKVIYLDPNFGIGPIGPNGGTVVVSEPASPIKGVQVVVPAGATIYNENFIVKASGDGYEPIGGYKAISASVFFEPMLMHFAKDVIVTIPFDPINIPAGATVNDIRVKAYSQDHWIDLPISSMNTSSVSFRTRDFEYNAVLLAVPNIPEAGKLRIESQPDGAEIFLDGMTTGFRTPVVLEGISAGAHEVAIYRDGYNEGLQNINYTGGKVIFFDLVKTGSNAPTFEFGSIIYDGMEVSNSLINISGTVHYNGAVPAVGRLNVSVNGYDTLEASSGNFTAALPLVVGENFVRFKYTTNSVTGVSQTFKIIRSEFSKNSHEIDFPHLYVLPSEDGAEAERKRSLAPPPRPLNTLNLSASPKKQDVRVRLNWSKDEVDVDLHIYDDKGNHAHWGDLAGIPGGRLDRDDTNGYGPESFNVAFPLPGTYTIKVHYYSDRGKGPTTANVQTYIGGKIYSAATGSQSLTNDGWWTVGTFKIEGQLQIEEVTGIAGKSKEFNSTHCSGRSGICSPGRFTAGAEENAIRIKTWADESILDNEISYKVTELLTGDVVTNVRGRDVHIALPMVDREGGGFKRTVKPLIYKIEALYQNQKSVPYFIVQDTRSMIQQEYIDLKYFTRNAIDEPKKKHKFVKSPPKYEDIGTGTTGKFPGSPYYTWGNFIGYPRDHWDFGVLNKSVVYANEANRLFQENYFDPPNLPINSGYRNPRKNYELYLTRGGAIDSYHQGGDAVDLDVPFAFIAKRPDRHLMYMLSYKELCHLIYNKTSMAVDVFTHGGSHVHVEPRTKPKKPLCDKLNL